MEAVVQFNTLFVLFFLECTDILIAFRLQPFHCIQLCKLEEELKDGRFYANSKTPLSDLIIISTTTTTKKKTRWLILPALMAYFSLKLRHRAGEYGINIMIH